MKTITSFLAIVAIAASGNLAAQTAAYTSPSGYVDLGAVAARSEITFSLPLLTAPEANATVSSASSSVITLEGTPLVAGAFDAPASGAPYMVEISTGVSAGLFLVVSSNTSSSISVLLGGGETLNDLVLGDKLTLRKAWTLETLFPSANLPNGVRVSVFDIGAGINKSATKLYIDTSSGWVDGANFSSASNAVLYPGESFVFINNTDTAIPSLMIAGQVPTSRSRMRIGKDVAGAPQDTRIAYVGSGDETLNLAGFNPYNGDRLLAFDQTSTGINKSASKVLIFSSSAGDWLDGANFAAVGNTFTLKPGQGYIYRRSANAPTGDQIITDEQSYIQGLNN